MAEIRDRIFVSIGVSKAGSLVELPGAITASERMADWAEANGYTALRLNDAIHSEVTVDLLRREIIAAIEKVTDQNILQRLVIFFAGHGAAMGLDDQNWLLSKWDKRRSEVVNIASLLRALEYYGPRQVTIIGDACQEFSARFIEIVGGPVLDTTDEARQRFQLDKFFPVDAGSQAFMIKATGTQEAFCVFTEVILDALEGTVPPKYFEADGDGQHVTSQKIAEFLDENLEKEAGKYGVTMSPRLWPGFWSDRTYFSKVPGRQSGIEGPGMGMVATETKSLGQGSGDSGKTRAVERVSLTPRPAGTQAAQDEMAEMQRRRRAEEQAYVAAADMPVRDHFETGCGICFTGQLVRNVQASRGELSQEFLPPDWYRLQLSDQHNPMLWADVVFDLADGTTASACVVQNFVTAVHTFDRGGISVVHRPLHAAMYEGREVIDLLARLHAGTLTGTEVMEAAALLRVGKHRVLTMGAIAAQFYDSVRDTDGLRSIAWYYARAGQPIPLDVILYGGGRLFSEGNQLFATVPATEGRSPQSELERRFSFAYGPTPAVARHPVAGRVPWMRQAWSAVETAECDGSAEEWRARARAVTPHLSAGLFTIVGAAGREALEALAEIGRHDERPRPLAASA